MRKMSLKSLVSKTLDFSYILKILSLDNLNPTIYLVFLKVLLQFKIL
jgi:hypothetical protein